MANDTWVVSPGWNDLDLKFELVSMAEDLVKLDSKFRLAKNERDSSSAEDMWAATFLKYDEKRISRDFEIFNLMKKTWDVQATVLNIVEEILIPIKGFSPVCFNVARTRILTWKVFWDSQSEFENILENL